MYNYVFFALRHIGHDRNHFNYNMMYYIIGNAKTTLLRLHRKTIKYVYMYWNIKKSIFYQEIT